MTIEAAPVGVQCNLSCPYCYQHPLRDGGHAAPAPYNLEAMKATLAAQKWGFTLFGGEILLMPFDDLADLVRWGAAFIKTLPPLTVEQRKRGRSDPSIGIQTNGTLLTEAHFALFKECNVHVGMSLDGPDDLNDMRWAGSVEKTREQTIRSQWALNRLCELGRPPSLILTLHRRNAGPAVRARLLRWCRELYAKGVRAIRLHFLEVDHDTVGEELALSDADLQAVLEEFMTLQSDPDLPDLDMDLFHEVQALLRGQDRKVNCVWNACDPYTTPAVNAVGPQGERVNCGRVEKSGVPWRKADASSFERQLTLYATPQSEGGCQDCRFFLMCKGHCPGSAVDGDWRMRSSHCATLMWLFEKTERLLTFMGETPVSRRRDRAKLEALMIDRWSRGINLSIADALEQLRTGATAAPARPGDRPHGDVPHGDHTDTARRAS